MAGRKRCSEIIQRIIKKTKFVLVIRTSVRRESKRNVDSSVEKLWKKKKLMKN